MKIIKNGKKCPGSSDHVIFLNVFVILLYCCKCVFQLSAVSLNSIEQCKFTKRKEEKPTINKAADLDYEKISKI